MGPSAYDLHQVRVSVELQAGHQISGKRPDIEMKTSYVYSAWENDADSCLVLQNVCLRLLGSPAKPFKLQLPV